MKEDQEKFEAFKLCVVVGLSGNSLKHYWLKQDVVNPQQIFHPLAWIFARSRFSKI